MDQRSPEISSDVAAEKAVAAMLLELVSPKPGNVSRFQDLSELGLDQFLASVASLAIPFHDISSGKVAVGEGVLNAVQRMSEAQGGGNTHLGAILLIAPMAASVSGATPDLIRPRLKGVLEGLTPEDGHYLFDAIALVHPALPPVREFDVYETPAKMFENVSVLEWMAGGIEPGMQPNSIAREYVTDFEFTFERSHPFLRETLERASLEDAITHCFLWILSQQTDTLLIARHGQDEAERIMKRAQEIMGAGGYLTDKGRNEAAGLNRELVDRGMNPGTSADLVTAAIYVELLSGYQV
jgi:triphosphoribosyl-dephospho-CoA synthase